MSVLQHRESPFEGVEEKSQYRPLFKEVQEFARNSPHELAATFDSVRISYGELWKRVSELAGALIQSGIHVGDRVATMSSPRPEFLISYLASTSIGAIWQGLNPRYKARELQYVINDARPKVIFSLDNTGSDPVQDNLLTAIAAVPSYNPELIGFDTQANTEFTDDFKLLSEYLKASHSVTAAQIAERQQATAGSDPAIIVYTSGTTGTPKGALVRHSGLSRLAHIQTQQWALTPPRIICNQPINHIGCVGDLCSVTLYAGGTLHFMDTFDTSKMIDLIEEQEINGLLQIPTQLQLLAADPKFESAKLESLEKVGWGGGSLALSVIEKFRDKNCRISNTYGLTEVTSSVSYSRRDASNSELMHTVGQPDPALKIRFLDVDGTWGSDKGPGEICVKHETVMAGYLNLPEATADAFTDDGWLRTGDLGQIDEHGNLLLIGRTKEMYKSGGYNIYPKEIEHLLEMFPGVEAAAVVPRPDSVFSEVGVAFVEGQSVLELDEIKEYLRKNLANYKVPKEVFQVEMPRLENQKIDKQTLKVRAAS